MSTGMQTQPQTQGTALSPMVHLRNRLLSTLANSGKKLEGVIDRQAVLLACQSIEKNPALLQCSPESIFAAIVSAGAYGWTCDGVMGQGAIVPFKGVATLIPGYKGLRDLVRRAGECELTMESVHEGDEFTFRGRFSVPDHKPSKDPQRRFNPITGAYVVATFFAAKMVKCFWWSKEECIAHRDHYSQNWRRKPAKENPWHEENPAFRVMCMKTVLLDVIHRGEVPVRLKDRAMVDAAAVVDSDDGTAEQTIDGTVLSSVVAEAGEQRETTAEKSETPTPATTAAPPAEQPEVSRPADVISAPPRKPESVAEYKAAIDAADTPELVNTYVDGFIGLGGNPEDIREVTAYGEGRKGDLAVASQPPKGRRGGGQKTLPGA